MTTVLVLLASLILATSSVFAAGYTEPVTGMEFILVKGGCYQMGDVFGGGQPEEKPFHQVCLDDFYIGKFAVTQAQYHKIMGNNPSVFKETGSNYPVENVTWDDAHAFALRLAEKTGKKFHLPSEAEWEYAARSGGKNEKWPGTSDPKQLGDFAWLQSNSGNKTHPVGTKLPNSLGIYDMSGNVLQWCQDWHDDDYYKNSPRKNPEGPRTGSERVVRGGCFYLNTESSNTSRLSFPPDFRFYILGFRLAVSGLTPINAATDGNKDEPRQTDKK
jgi:formylglycine-generating enzyme required for sulfatase activity